MQRQAERGSGASVSVIPRAFKRLVEACRYFIFRIGFDWYYHGFLRDGAWRTPFLAHLDFSDGERILEVHRRGSCVTADIVRNHPNTQINLVDIDPLPGAPKIGSIAFEHNRLTCNPGQFDKVICSMVLHPFSPALKILLLNELRRVLRNGGEIYLVDFDAPIEPLQGTILRGLSYKFGYQSLGQHIDGTWTVTVKKAGFRHIKLLQTVPEWHSRVTVMRARR